MESLVLSFGVGFECLRLSLAYVDVRIKNLPSQAIYRQFGMTEQRRDDRNIYLLILAIDLKLTALHILQSMKEYQRDDA